MLKFHTITQVPLFLMMIALITGCKKLDELTQFDMEYRQELVIPSSTLVDLPFNLATPEVESNSNSRFAAEDTRKDLIEEIRLTLLQLKITAPGDGSFSFLKSIRIFLSAEGLSETKVAWRENIPDNPGRELTLHTTDDDLKAYIKKDHFELRINYVTDEALTRDQEVEVFSRFFVNAEILGQ